MGGKRRVGHKSPIRSRVSLPAEGKGYHPTKMRIEKDTENKPGTFKEKYVYTDIKTYLSGEIVESFAIKGVTLIDFDALGKYGKFTWNGAAMEIKLVLD